MNTENNMVDSLFDITGKVCAITGGAGVLCGTIGKALAARGAKVALLDLFEDKAQIVADKIIAAGGEAVAVKCDVLDKASVQAAKDAVIAKFGRVDVLINGAGGNKKEATTSDELSFFDLPQDAFQWVFNLNFIGTLLPCQVFSKLLVEQDSGVIVNVSSMSAYRPLTKVGAYSAAKAAISNFTAWLAVHLSQLYSKKVRVNAIAPGFFDTAQNHYLLFESDDKTLTPRGQQIVSHTPMDRFGEPEELVGAIVWLLSDAGKFVHGAVIPIDGGFDAYSGV